MVSLANAKDFSWRKRVAAGEAGLVMMAEKPFAGFGWNQPERVYAHFYQAPKVDEGMAFQLNDYVTLGTTLGLPALACFVAYAGLSLRGQEKREVEEGRWDDGRWLRVTCRAGAIVLLVGFFFDGGLLQLATGATFWILLELGKENGRWEMEERRAG
jgi:O-antigen ligase